MTQEGRLSARLERRVQACRVQDRQIRPADKAREVMGRENRVPKQPNPYCHEKPLSDEDSASARTGNRHR